MKRIVLYSLLAIFCSCQSQEIKKQDILGNWYPEYSSELADGYFELYIDNDKFYYITKIGWGPSEAYKLEGNKLYLESFDEQGEPFMVEEGNMTIESGILIMETSNGKTSLLRLNSSPNLGDCVDGEFDGNKLLSFVLERRTEWQKDK
jgi:hypothetical protein